MRSFARALLVSSLASSMFVFACSAPTEDTEAVAGDEQDMTSAWFKKNVPPGSATEKAVLALLNDRSMSEDEYVETCNVSKAAAINIVNYRNGDEPADTTDDEVFETVAEADRMPFTDRGFWVAAIQCAKAHYLPKPNGGTCATGTSKIEQSPLAIQFVLDGSGSMEMDSKWTAASEALREVFAAQGAKADPDVAMGLVVFSSAVDVDVPLGGVDAGKLTALQAPLGAHPPQAGGTEMKLALDRGYANLEAFQALPGATKALVLLTDGVPSGGATENKAVLDLVTAKASSIQLHALGVGKLNQGFFDYDPKFMGSLAIAGGTRASATCSETEALDVSKMCHFQVTPGQKAATVLAKEIGDAFASVRKNIAACDIGLQALGTGAIDPSEVEVVVSDGTGPGKKIAADAANGFSLDDATNPTKVLLRGTACAELRANAALTARVTLGCE